MWGRDTGVDGETVSHNDVHKCVSQKKNKMDLYMTACLHFHVSTQRAELCQVVSVHAMKAYGGARCRPIKR